MMQTTPTRPLPKIIVLSVLLYRCLLSLGPGAFRRNYAVPALQDFRQCCRDAYQQQGSFGVLRLWPGLLGETVPGLLVEYWTEFFGRRHPMLSVVRRSIVAVFWAFVLFLFSFTALEHIADPVAPFDAVGHLHPEVAITYALFAHSGVVALLAVLLGGLPILFISVKRAFAGGPTEVLKLFLIKPKQALLLLGVALIITVYFVAYLLGTEYIFGSPTTPCPTAQHCLGQQSPGIIVLNLSVIIGGITLGVFVVLMLSASLSLAVLHSEFGKGMLRFTLAPIGILALTMATATLASAIWTSRLWVDAPQFAASGSGLGNGQTAWVIVIIVAMTVSTVVTAGAFISSLRASLLRTS
jgi:hypothetical protein